MIEMGRFKAATEINVGENFFHLFQTKIKIRIKINVGETGMIF
jgi:hypothetical protein